MISLEEEIAKIAKEKLGGELTASDILNFFECEEEHILRMINIKQLALSHAQTKYDSLGRITPDNKNTPITKILDDLTKSLEIARLQFEDIKLTKSYEIVRELKLAVITVRHDIINECLLDLQELRECTKDTIIISLEDQLAKYSAMAEEEGVIYLDFHSRQEQREILLASMIELKYQLIALNNLI